jgi:murein DD-endopeptidase MepM/ murein hydrolase activator NlpD
VSKGSDNGRHRRRRRHVTFPSVIGSAAMVAAASGALAMPQAAGSISAAGDPLEAEPGRPHAADTSAAGALDTIAAAGASLTTESTETAQQAHAQVVEQQRKDAAERAARAEREGKRWVLPVSNYRITAGFGSAGRMWSNRHTGLDFAAPSGTEVRSISRGEIIFAGYDGPYGNKIVIRHWDGTETWYCHLSRYIQRSGGVMPGTPIGRVGSTGNTTGPHLHLEIHPDGGDPVNPRTWLADHGLTV